MGKNDTGDDPPPVCSGAILDAALIRKYKLIPGLDERSLQVASYDLRLGEAHRVYTAEELPDGSHWKRVYIGKNIEAFNRDISASGEQFDFQNHNDKLALVIPARGAAFVQLYETVDTLSVSTLGPGPHPVIAGRFDLRLHWTNAGLMSQQATQVEPFYKGKLFCFVYNMSDEAVRIKRLDRFATIEFSFVALDAGECVDEMYAELYKKYEGRVGASKTGILDIRYFSFTVKLPKGSGLLSLESGFNSRLSNIAGELKKDAEFIDDVSELVRKRISHLTPVIAGVATILAALVGGIIQVIIAYFQAMGD